VGATLLFGASPSGAQLPVGAATTLGLDEVIRSAEDRYPMIVAAARDRDAAEGDLLAAEGGFDPSWKTGATVVLGGYPSQRIDTLVEQPTPLWGASLFAGYRISAGQFATYDGKLVTNPFGEVRAGARVPLWRDGPIDRRRASIRRAELGVEIAKLSVSQQRIEVVRAASYRYWDWAAAGRRLSIVRDWVNLAVRRDADLGERVARGDIPAIERTENQRTILQRQAALAAAERALAEASNELSLFLRDREGKAIVPAPERLPPSISEAVAAATARADEQAALERRPELPRLEAQRAQARVELDWAKNQRMPAVDVMVMGSKDFGPGDVKLDKPVFEASVLIDIPLVARVPRGRVKAAEATMARIDEQTRLAKDRIVADVRNAKAALVAAQDRAALAKQELTVARQLAEAEAQRFLAGDGTLLIVNLREQAAAEAALRHVDALVDWHKAAANYRAATAAGL